MTGQKNKVMVKHTRYGILAQWWSSFANDEI